jgi:transmembrane sensor
MLNKIRQALKPFSPARRDQEPDDGAIQKVLRESADRLHRVDPGTQHQWQQLQRAINQGDAVAMPVRGRLLLGFAVGAAAVALLAIAAWFYAASPEAVPDVFATRVGEQKEITLRDGSEVTLNYASQLNAATTQRDNARRFSLKGEAYFRVQHTGSPFIVSTANADVEVVGTEFDVRERDGELEIGVITGAVKVRVMKRGKDSTLMLTKNQVGYCPRDGFPQRLNDIASAEYPGWLHGKLLLDHTAFPAACKELEMRFGITITLHDQTMKSKVITGILDARTAERGLAALCELTGKHYTHAGTTFTVD